MAVFTVDTVHNVGIDYETAGVGERVIAELIDNVIKVGTFFGLIYLTSTFKPFKSEWFIYIALIPIVFYSLLFEFFLSGQTPGKKLRKIKVNRLDGASPSFGDYVLRWLFRLIDINITSGCAAVVSVVVSKHHQRIGDMLAGTTVVRVSKRITIEELTYVNPEVEKSVTFPEVLRLSQEDVDLIQQVLTNKDYLDNFELVVKLTDKISKKMNLKLKIPHEEFLRTVVKDYSQLVNE